MSDYQFRALIVDDEASMREELAILLQEHGMQVDTAADGEEGLQKLLSDEFDVAVVDLKMPKMGGLEMIRKADEAEVDTYIVILTGHGDKEDAVAALRLQHMVKDWFEKSDLDVDAFVKSVKFPERIKRIAGGVSRELVSKIMSKPPPVPMLK